MKSSFLIFVFLLSCVGPVGPEERVRSFYKDLASAKDVDSLSNHFSSPLSFDAFKVPIRPLKINNLKFVSSNEKSDYKVFLTVDLQMNKKESDIEVRKIFELSKINQDWKIDKVENVKTYIEVKKSIEIKKPLN